MSALLDKGAVIFQNFMANCQPVFYRLYEGQEEVKDQYGNSTGQYIPKYSDLKSAMMCVSPNKGTSETEQFGSFEEYDRTVTTVDASLDINEDAVLWVDGADTDGPWNYVVKAVARWFNSLQLAIAQVDVTPATQSEEAKDEDTESEEPEDVQV